MTTQWLIPPYQFIKQYNVSILKQRRRINSVPFKRKIKEPLHYDEEFENLEEYNIQEFKPLLDSLLQGKSLEKYQEEKDKELEAKKKYEAEKAKQKKLARIKKEALIHLQKLKDSGHP